MSTQESQIVKYQTKDKKVNLEILVLENTVWLTQAQMSELFTKNKRTISEHIKNIFKEGELKEKIAVRNIRISAPDGKVYKTNHYNFDVIISVGYRVKSSQITPFRYWVKQQLDNAISSSKNDGFAKGKILNNLDEILNDIDVISAKIKKSTFKKMKF
ncbi:MAG: virulence RhuM family protein [Draconibacterium sp.]|nr:virulence RhuM family protein [Draconibacterium sp.]